MRKLGDYDFSDENFLHKSNIWTTMMAMIVDDIRLEIGSNLEKIRGSKVLVPLESPGFSD